MVHRFTQKSWASLVIGLSVVGLLLLAACSKKEESPVLAASYGERFIPLEVGSYIDYRFDSLDQNRNRPGADSLRQGTVLERWLLRDTLESTSLQRGYELAIYQRADTSQPWKLKRTTGMFLRFDGPFLVQEKGVLKQLLTVPFQDGTSWNLNAFNAESQTTSYTYRFVDVTSDSVARFSGIADSNCLSATLHKVEYKAGIGLVNRHDYEAVFVDDPDSPCTPPFKYQTRQSRTWTYIASGKL